jgi:hypothetical protein
MVKTCAIALAVGLAIICAVAQNKSCHRECQSARVTLAVSLDARQISLSMVRVAAGALHRPDWQGLSRRLATMPSAPSAQAWRKIVSSSPSRCSDNRMPRARLAQQSG